MDSAIGWRDFNNLVNTCSEAGNGWVMKGSGNSAMSLAGNRTPLHARPIAVEYKVSLPHTISTQ